MTHLDVIGSDKGKVGLETVAPKLILDDAAARMLKSIQDSIGFPAAEDAVLKWLEGCSLEGVERFSVALEDYLQNRREAESEPE